MENKTDKIDNDKKKQTLTENLIKFLENYDFNVDNINVHIKNISEGELEYTFTVRAIKKI